MLPIFVVEFFFLFLGVTERLLHYSRIHRWNYALILTACSKYISVILSGFGQCSLRLMDWPVKCVMCFFTLIIFRSLKNFSLSGRKKKGKDEEVRNGKILIPSEIPIAV